MFSSPIAQSRTPTEPETEPNLLFRHVPPLAPQLCFTAKIQGFTSDGKIRVVMDFPAEEKCVEERRGGGGNVKARWVST